MALTKTRRKWISRISATQKRRMTAYNIKAGKWKKENPTCKVCLLRGRKPKKTRDVHHCRGRISTLLFDSRYWLPVCRPCHNFIHDNVAWAREQGFIGPWGKVE